MRRGLFNLEQPLSELLPSDDAAPLTPGTGQKNPEGCLGAPLGLAGLDSLLCGLDGPRRFDGGVSERRPGRVGSHCAKADACTPCGAILFGASRRAIEPKPTGHYRYSDCGVLPAQGHPRIALETAIGRVGRQPDPPPFGPAAHGIPPAEWAELEHIAPTELDTAIPRAWVRGTVHDPGAAMLGGVAGHAGLFSDAHDLALLMEVMRHGRDEMAFNW